MQPSSNGLDLIKQREGFVAKAKPDVNGLAIGYGMHTYQGKPVTADLNITQEDANKELWDQVTKFVAPVFMSILKVPINQNQYDALLSVAWNSPAAARNLAQKLNRGLQLTLQDFLASGTVNGKPHPGLQNRRAAEYKQFSSTNY